MLDRMHRDVSTLGRDTAGREIVGYVIVAVCQDRAGELSAARIEALPSGDYERECVVEAITEALEADR